MSQSKLENLLLLGHFLKSEWRDFVLGGVAVSVQSLETLAGMPLTAV